jgi:hypothetical protein
MPKKKLTSKPILKGVVQCPCCERLMVAPDHWITMPVSAEITKYLTCPDCCKDFVMRCCYCNRLKVTTKKWVVSDNKSKNVSHGICPDCMRDKAMPQLKALEEEKRCKSW